MFLLYGLGIWFWSIIIIEFILLTWFVENEASIPSFISIVAVLFLLWWLADIPVWDWIKNNPWQLCKYCLYYIGVGLIWSVGKYFFVLKKMQEYIKRLKKCYLNDPNKTEKVNNFKEYVDLKRNANWSNTKDYLAFENSTKKLVFWATFWPTSMFWTILNDPIKRLFTYIIHDLLIKLYRKMYDRMVGDLIEIKKKDK